MHFAFTALNTFIVNIPVNIIHLVVQASEVLLFNRKLNAQEALRCGLVGDVFPKEEFYAKVEERLKEYLDNPAKVK